MKGAWMMGLGFFVSSKDLVFPINAMQELETSMWSLLCLMANKSSGFIIKPLNCDCVCILRPWITCPSLCFWKAWKAESHQLITICSQTETPVRGPQFKSSFPLRFMMWSSYSLQLLKRWYAHEEALDLVKCRFWFSWPGWDWTWDATFLSGFQVVLCC